MTRRRRAIASIIGACISVALVAGCGGAGTSGETLAVIAGHPITQTLLNQWMIERTGEDYYLVSSHRAPAGLVSEPANYPACIATLKKLTPIPGEGPPQPQPTLAQLTTRCEQLYQTVKAETMKYLVWAYWNINFDAHHGITIGDPEVERAFEQLKAQRWPKPGQFQQEVLVARTRTVPQELFTLKMNRLETKLEKKLEGGRSLLYATLVREAKSAKEDCRPGYVVELCKGYKPPKERFATTNTGAPGPLLEEVARWRPETSHGFTGATIH
jgi:hypothetical protein